VDLTLTAGVTACAFKQVTAAVIERMFATPHHLLPWSPQASRAVAALAVVQTARGQTRTAAVCSPSLTRARYTTPVWRWTSPRPGAVPWWTLPGSTSTTSGATVTLLVHSLRPLICTCKLRLLQCPARWCWGRRQVHLRKYQLQLPEKLHLQNLRF